MRFSKIYVFFVFLVSNFLVAAENSKPPEEITIEGKVQLIVEDNSGEIILEKFLKGPEELKSAMSCSINLSADDSFYNTYPGSYQLTAIEQDTVYLFSVESKYLDENSRYHRVPITSASIKVADKVINSELWESTILKQKYSLLDINSDLGLSIYHELTLGQPANVQLLRDSPPKIINIEFVPLTAKQSAVARKCMKLVLRDL